MRTSYPSFALATLVALLLMAPGGASAAPLEIEHGDTGWTVRATGARVEDVLGALAEREPFAVAMQLGVERPLVDVDVRDASLDEVLRDVLRGRNYVITYRSFAYRDAGDGLAVSRVELLLPRPPSDATEPAVVLRADLSAEDAARVAARQQRLREQQMFARLRSASAGATAQPAAATAGRAQPVPQRPTVATSEPLPLHRQMWNRIFSGAARDVR